MLCRFRHVPRRWRLCRVGAGMCLCLALVIAGCSYSGSPHPYTLPQLHISHLQWLPALSRIPQANRTHGGVIYGLAAFQRPDDSTTQVIVNFSGGLQMIGVDGSGRHALNMGDDCLSPAAVTNDGDWIACVSSPDSDNGDDRLQLAALHPNGTSQVHQIQLTQQPFYTYPTWSPDGKYLALALGDIGTGCSVAIFSSQPPHTKFALAVILTSEQFSAQDGDCGIYDIEWSLDGHRLFVLGFGAAAFVATIPVATLLQADGSVEVPSDEFETFPSVDVYAYSLQMSMDPQGDTVLYMAGSPAEQLTSFDVHTHQSAVLFTLPGEYHIRAVIWMPNGRQFLIAVGDKQCVDCGQYAISDVYLYSPDA